MPSFLKYVTAPAPPINISTSISSTLISLISSSGIIFPPLLPVTSSLVIDATVTAIPFSSSTLFVSNNSSSLNLSGAITIITFGTYDING